ncbi:VCBS repeat-containing protein [Amphritea opalescens]|uniref:VCBS repeat-containing protein n=1 Tax=Amphritea opalescens TaxID=2490544 RepID=A0A430KQ53_9GAMM|nr:VCBS repeat-containing protein [Amphritea opalescens]RTE65602.1 VCBS repeat-containing protein [Amphritea opalescens]
MNNEDRTNQLISTPQTTGRGLLHKVFRSSIALCLLATSVASYADESVTLERVRYCDQRGLNNICAGTATTPSKFQAWSNAGVSTEGQRNTYISIVNQPPKDQVRKVVFISAGQQTDPGGEERGKIGKGYPNVLTGQPNDYKDGCMNATKSCTRTIDARSVLGRLRGDGKFSDSDTLFIAAFDMRFGYYRPSAEKQRRENAYWDFLTSQFDPSKVELIVLAGQSRGGCMMFRLGQKLRATSTYQNIPLIVQGLDPVCTTTGTPNLDRELPQLSGVYRNPLNNSYESYPIDMDQVFPSNHRNKLAVLDIHGGGEVWAQEPGIRSFTWKASDTDLGWWEQKWVNAGHEDMGGKYEHSWQTVDLAVTHIYDSMYVFGSTHFKSTDQHPVDINGDGLSDIVLRSRNPQQGLIIHTKLSNGDGSFIDKAFISGDGSAVDLLPMLSGYFNADNKTDLLLRYYHPQNGLTLRTKLSNGDGSFTEKEYQAGDGHSDTERLAFIGDVDGDKLSDLISLYQHPTSGLHIRVKYSNGDGSFRETDHRSGDGAMGDSMRMHAADVNGDGKTDLIYHFQNGADNFQIRTQISNGDGSFTYKKLIPGGWWYMNNMQSFVGDVNRDKKSDLILITRDHGTKLLRANTYISQGDGTYHRVIHDLAETADVDKLEILVGDFNGDRRTDILLRKRDPQQGLILRLKLSKGDGHYTHVQHIAGDGPQIDNFSALIGNIDKGLTTDLILRARTANGILIRSKLSKSDGSFSEAQYNATGDLLMLMRYPALSGAMRWAGGGTFHPCGGCVKTVSTADKVAVKKATVLPQIKPSVSGGKVVNKAINAQQLKQ